MNLPLAGIEGTIGQLVLLLIIALVGWGTKRASDAERKRRGPAPPPGPPPGAPRDPAGPPPVPQRVEPHHLPPVDPHVGHLHPGAVGRSIQPMHLRVRSVLEDTPESTGRVVDARQRQLQAWRKLAGGLAVKPGRSLTRAGVLWSEVLGPPRAIAGPHRSPAARRRR